MNRNLLSLILIAMCSCFSFHALANERTDTVSVVGVCQSCKARIEKAAKQAGASLADWNDKTKVLSVTYNDSAISLLAIEKNIAFMGHDTRDVKATMLAYNKLPACCKYDRNGIAVKTKACEEDKKE